jgi:hypothetical protein
MGREPISLSAEVAALRAEVAELRLLVLPTDSANLDASRPEIPTAAYCCPFPFRIRWQGHKDDVPPRLWQLFRYLLGRRPNPVGVVAEVAHVDDVLRPHDDADP